MAFSISQPLDLYNLFITQVTGSETIFIFVSFFLIAGFAAKMRFPNSITITLFAIYGLIIGMIFQTVLIITVFVIAILLFLTLNRLFNK